MEVTFNSHEYFLHLAEDIINNFSKASRATTPVLVGTARENEIRLKLEKLLPSKVAIATGCIIDSYGNTSTQTDVILYERDQCPVFSINDTPEATYVPCEGVVAIGEIKSTLTTADLKDSINKIKRVKELQRYSNNNLCWRKYGSTMALEGTPSEKFDQINKTKDQIYGFILCQKFGLKIDTLLDNYKELLNNVDDHLSPNMIISLEDGIIIFMDKKNNKTCENKVSSDAIYFFKHPEGEFQYLLTKLNQVINTGRTTEVLPYERYILKNTQNIPGNGIIKNI
ncbi:DUF6602 domain-containing protein [Aliarcobacter butzleri]|uniref:DUF6602 domain-containing protein n=1 Tax=Aliarcobacter cryaerophilus TaxID=28198 RepID=UPI00112F12BD|nr:DUF6602 domain-containing protein [Aliarcobacter cryaerophilus]